MKKFFLLLGLMVMLVACGGGQASEPLPTPLPPTAEPVVVSVEQTAVSPTETAAPPPAPPTMAPVPTSTPVVAAPIEGVVLQTLADFGTDRNPLTGELVEDKSLLQKRPLAIKLSNSPPIYTRPQSGLNDADWIYEHTTEGAITRFTAIFYGKLPPRVGPIRSARLIDLELPAMYDAALAFSGASNGVLSRLAQVDFQPRILYATEPGYYRTGEDKPFEHTLYGDPLQFHQDLATKGLDIAPTFTTVNAFSSVPPAAGQSASAVRVDYDWTVIDWRYDEASGEYLRWADDQIHADGNTGEQVAVSNVVIISPNHVEDGEICEEVRDGVCAHLSIQVQLWGSGAASVFRDGQQYNVTWQRQGRTDSLTFTDSAGNPFPLQIGNSWVQVVPNWLTNPVTVTP
ncbi:MAG: DUF3048 domain-containing protein [Anaerolineales bacterium]|nr:DUF3048 domain-containing protein [Anaerolineales bacterium]